MITAYVWQLISPAQAQTAAGTVPPGAVAMVNGTPILVSQVDAAVKAAQQPDTQKLRQSIKTRLINRELLQQAAEKNNYDAKPGVQEAVQLAKANAEIRLYLLDNVHPTPVSDAQIKVSYDEGVAELGEDELKLRVIVVGDTTTAATVLSQLKAGKPFDVLARQYSMVPSSSQGGELPWLSFRAPAKEGRTAGLPLAVAKVVMQLPVGANSLTAVAAEDMQVIVKLEAKRPTQVPPFDDVKESIRKQLQAQAQERAIDALVSGLRYKAVVVE
jgi:parvulin-like peptidyl-prolyl isomerase